MRENDYLTVVKWHDGMWCVKKDLPLCHTIAIASVIGNVHDNPDLLEVAHD